jgi:Inositol monophosphatase family
VTLIPDRLDEICSALVEAVTAGAVEVLTVKLAGDLDVQFKDAKELVTAADKNSDAAILAVFHRRLTAIDPAISFQLEESGVIGTCEEKRAGADPIDGTTHFASGGHWYSSSRRSTCRWKRVHSAWAGYHGRSAAAARGCGARNSFSANSNSPKRACSGSVRPRRQAPCFPAFR